jgi:hypothetical protein
VGPATETPAICDTESKFQLSLGPTLKTSGRSEQTVKNAKLNVNLLYSQAAAVTSFKICTKVYIFFVANVF